MRNLTEKQIIGKLLLEAVELLNESNARHKYVKLQEEKSKRNDKLARHSPKYRYDGKPDRDVYKDRASEARANIGKYGTGASKGGYNGGIAYALNDNEIDARKVELRGTRDGGRTFSHETPKENEIIRGGRLAKNEFNKMVDEHSKNNLNRKRNADLHERISARTHNESANLAILLAEAAELLNEEETLAQSHLKVYNDKGYLIPDEDDDPDRDERRIRGAKEIAKAIAAEKSVEKSNNQ